MEREQLNGPRGAIAQSRPATPRTGNANGFDPTTDVVVWPRPLQQAEYDEQRIAIDRYLAKLRYGGLDYPEQRILRQQILAMFDGMKSRINDISPQEYVECRAFLGRLLYATTRSQI